MSKVFLSWRWQCFQKSIPKLRYRRSCPLWSKSGRGRHSKIASGGMLRSFLRTRGTSRVVFSWWTNEAWFGSTIWLRKYSASSTVVLRALGRSKTENWSRWKSWISIFGQGSIITHTYFWCWFRCRFCPFCLGGAAHSADSCFSRVRRRTLLEWR